MARDQNLEVLLFFLLLFELSIIQYEFNFMAFCPCSINIAHVRSFFFSKTKKCLHSLSWLLSSTVSRIDTLRSSTYLGELYSRNSNNKHCLSFSYRWIDFNHRTVRLSVYNLMSSRAVQRSQRLRSNCETRENSTNIQF